MKTEWWTAVIATGLTAGYATTVTQLSPGPTHIFSKLRKALADKTENATSETVRSFGELAYCGWCLSPYMTIPVWATMAKAFHIRFGIKWMTGLMAAASIAAYYRHQAESRI